MSEEDDGSNLDPTQSTRTSFGIRSMSSLHRLEKSHSRQHWASGRRQVMAVVESRRYDVVMSIIIILNAVFIIYETDLRARGGEPPVWSRVVDFLLLAIYVVDVGAHLYALRLQFFGWNLHCVNLFVVVSDIVSVALHAVIGDIPSFAIIRMCRLSRLIRCLKVLSLARELKIMLISFASAMRAMFWAGIMLVVVLTLWSIVAVELLHPINMRLVERGFYADCERCQRAFSSVMNANLTFLQQLVAGDSWGQVSIPIIEEEPATAVIFVAVMTTINLGLLNLVLTAIVDVANTSREADLHQKILDKQTEFQAARESLLALCAALDEDGSGTLHLEELLGGFHSNPEFAKTMTALEVQERDMDVIFQMLDEDNSGTVSYTEFVEQLHKMKSQDTHTMLVFIKGYLNEVRLKMAEQTRFMQKDVHAECKSLSRTLHKLAFGRSGGSAEDQKPVQICIQGASGLAVAEGARAPYCVCEVAGKPTTRVQTGAVTDSENPCWEFRDDIAEFVSGDELVLSVWSESVDSEDALLGRAVLTHDQLIQGEGRFEGALALDLDTGEKGACVRVKVESPDVCTHSSVISIGDDLKQLSQRVDRELAPLMRNLVDQMNEQWSQLQKQTSCAAWPAAADGALAKAGPPDDAPPSYPERAGEVKSLSQRSGNSSTGTEGGRMSTDDAGGELEKQLLGTGAPKRVSLSNALAAAPSLPGLPSTSRV